MNTRRIGVLLVVLLCCLALVGIALAQGQSSYILSWSVIGAGGGASQSLNYKLSGTMGQGLAGAASSSSYRLGVGFWYGAPLHYSIYLPVVLSESQ